MCLWQAAWGFWAHRISLYQRAIPHHGYKLLLDLISQKAATGKTLDSFVFTSNVDGAFGKAGFAAEQIMEVHGAISRMQCTQRRCPGDYWYTPENLNLKFNEKTFRLTDDVPICQHEHCNLPARPNVLMFGDSHYISTHTSWQESNMDNWQSQMVETDAKVVVIEIGAGKYVPTVRYKSEEICDQLPGATLIRINPRDPDIPRSEDISLPLRGLEALQLIQRQLQLQSRSDVTNT